MFISKMLETVDTHTAGNPTRNIVSGLPKIPGKTMEEKMKFVKENLNWAVTTAMWEPRGHSCMSGTILTEPCDENAHMGVIYIDAAGVMPMCGHSTIGCITAMLETGILPMTEPITEVSLDTAAGLISAKAVIKNNKVQSVSFKNVPSFLYDSKLLEVGEYGRVRIDVAYGGNSYAIVDADHFNLELVPSNLSKIIEVANLVGDVARREIGFCHPEKSFLNEISHVQFYSSPTNDEADFKNTVIFLPGSVDRSPCGTGTSARIAALYSYGSLGLNKEFVHESIIGTMFKARILEEVSVGGLKGGIPEITGTAHLTGMHKFVVDPEDSLASGFLMK